MPVDSKGLYEDTQTTAQTLPGVAEGKEAYFQDSEGSAKSGGSSTGANQKPWAKEMYDKMKHPTAGKVPIPQYQGNSVGTPIGPTGPAPTVQNVPTGPYNVPTVNTATVTLPGQGPQAANVNMPANMQLTGSINPAQIQFNQQQQYAQSAQAAQDALIKQLQGQASGTGPSVAGMQMQAGQEANLAALMAQMNSSRGAANPLMQRQAMMTGADIQSQTARDSAMARLQEQLQAQGLIGQVSGQMANQGLQQRGQDIGIAAQNAGFSQDANLARFGAQTQADLANYQGGLQGALANAGYQQQANMSGYDAGVQAALANAGFQQQGNMAQFGGQLGANQDFFNQQSQVGLANLGAQTDYNALLSQYANMGMGADIANQKAYLDYLSTVSDAEKTNLLAREEAKKAGRGQEGGLLQAAGSVMAAMASDENLKMDITDASVDIGQLLEAINTPKKYRYKDSKYGVGTYISPMAQELEKTKLGKDLVIDTPEGKMVHYSRAIGTVLSAQALLHKRINELEGKNKKGKK